MKPKMLPCPACKTGQRFRSQVCCRECWKEVPQALRLGFESASYRDAKVAAVRQIISHLTQQPELPLNPHPLNNDTNAPTERLKLKGPYELQVIIHAINDDEDTAKVTVNVSMGDLPTQGDIDRAIAVAIPRLAENGFRLMNKDEFFNQMMAERCGVTERFVCPGSEEWDS